MRASAALLFTLLVGCAASVEDEPPAGPNPSAKPPGNGWACIRERVTDTSLCTRPDLCDEMRLNYRNELDRRGASYDLTECAPRATVSCMTFRFTTETSLRFLCTEVTSECLALRDFGISNPADYADVSECGAW